MLGGVRGPSFWRHEGVTLTGVWVGTGGNPNNREEKGRTTRAETVAEGSEFDRTRRCVGYTPAFPSPRGGSWPRHHKGPVFLCGRSLGLGGRPGGGMCSVEKGGDGMGWDVWIWDGGNRNRQMGIRNAASTELHAVESTHASRKASMRR